MTPPIEGPPEPKPGVPAALLGRRTMMRGIAGFGLSIVASRAWMVVACAAPAATGAAASCAAFFAEPAPMRFLGALYLRERPSEADIYGLSEALFGGSPPPTAAGMAEVMAARRARDLRTADLVILDGWLLARSEAQLCALVALSGLSP